MLTKLVEEMFKNSGLPQAKAMDILIDFIESMVKDDRIVDEDVMSFIRDAIEEERKNIIRLDADTKEIIRLLFTNNVLASRPIHITFEVVGGVEYAIVKLEGSRWIPQVARVRRSDGVLKYVIENERVRASH